MWEILIFLKRFLSLKIQINSQKPGFGRKKKSVEDMLTLGPMAHATLVIMNNIWEVWKIEV
jgi:hypothetical protein